MIEKSQIKSVLDFIINVTREQIENTTNASKATLAGKNLDSYCACACGQYIVKGKKQRGVHGTSAAIRILGGTKNNDYNDILVKLINYLLNREKIDISDDELSLTNNFHHDSQNIIKLSEQLHSIHYVDPLVANTREILDRIASQLLDIYSKRNENGWGYFVNNLNGESELLPTAFAVMSISVHGNCSKIIKGIEVLSKSLSRYYDNEDTIKDPGTFAILIFSLYVLTFKVNKITRNKIVTDIELKKYFDSLWNSKFCMLDSHIEQDMDYWNEDDESFNVRIPWQLHTISLAAYFDSKKFSGLKVQKLLKSIYNGVEPPKKEFKYEYSGNHMSTRTLSILYETFLIIDKNYNSSLRYKLYAFYDKVIYTLSQTRVRKLIILLTVVGIGFIWYQITHDSKKILDYMAVHYLIILIGLLFGGRRGGHH